MTRDELMKLAAEKAINETDWESIKFLFRPSTMFELFLRYDFEGTKNLVNRWLVDDSPDALPFRFRREPLKIIQRCIEVEEFYCKLKALYDARSKVSQPSGTIT